MKAYVNLFIILFVSTLLCMGCEGKRNVDSNEEIYDEFGSGDDEDSGNPLGFTTITPEFSYEKNEWNNKYYWGSRYLTVQTSKGDYLYSDEDAERYYNNYTRLFLMAYILFSKIDYQDAEIREYLKSNFTIILNNLPLDDTFPPKIREKVNKLYYDWKDVLGTIEFSQRGYGYIMYKYHDYDNRTGYLTLKRDEEHNGRLIITYYYY